MKIEDVARASDLKNKIGSLKTEISKINETTCSKICVAFTDRTDSMYIENRYGHNVPDDFKITLKRILLAHYGMVLQKLERELECIGKEWHE